MIILSMRSLVLIRMSSQYCEHMDDSLVLTCSVDEGTLYTADPPSPFNRLFLADNNACKKIIPIFRENRFPTAWVIWNRSADFDDWWSFVDDLRQREQYIKIFREYDFIIKADDDILIRTKNWDRILLDKMTELGLNCVSLGASAFSSNNLALVNQSKLVMYRTEYLMRDGPIKITPTFMHPNVICEVLSETKSERSPIGRTLIAS